MRAPIGLLKASVGLRALMDFELEPNMKTSRPPATISACRGYTLVEIVIAIVLLSVVVGALYSGMVYGMRQTQYSRENVRATQVMVEKLEQLRLYPAYKLTSYFDPDDGEDPMDPFDAEDPHRAEDDEAVFNVPTTFTVPFKPGATNAGDLIFTGTFTIATNVSFAEPYKNDMVLVTVGLTWNSRGRLQTRQMQTYFAKYGMQNNLLIPQRKKK